MTDVATLARTNGHSETPTTREPWNGPVFRRMLTRPGQDPRDTVKWKKATAEISNDKGKVIFRQEGVEFPEPFSQLAINVTAQKYFYGPKEGVGRPMSEGGREHSLAQPVDRIVDTITEWGRRGGYFPDDEQAETFRAELKAAHYHQLVAFNSPVWFNVGIGQKYGIPGSSSGYRWDPKAVPVYGVGEDEGPVPRIRHVVDFGPPSLPLPKVLGHAGGVVRCHDGHLHPQASACFIQSISDDMESIMNLAKSEAMLFKAGSGTGTDLSTLRSARERLSGGGRPSGPISFMKVYDAGAGVIKSGGKTRRAAKMQTLKDHHPDILEFIECKTKEEKKAQALIRAGFESNYNGEAYSSVAFQNANLSVRVSNRFLQAAEAGQPWQTLAVQTGTELNVAGERMPSYEASELLDKIAEGTWLCGDPGVQYDSTIQEWHTCPNSGRIESSNPCQPAFATVLTPEGVRLFADIDVDSIIWSGRRWTRVVRKVATGVKPVQLYRTTAGTFIGTACHNVISEGERVPAGEAETFDIAAGPVADGTEEFDPSDVMDGWVFGDGSVHKASNNLVHLNIGGDDACIHKHLGEFIVRPRPGIGPYAWEVNTTLEAGELPLTFERVVPERFLFGPAAKKRGFLRGLYAANGSVCGGRVTLKAASICAIDEVQTMLSSLGIRSYYTTNKPSKIRFSNGEYECKESYDLNITVDRDRFAALIGFMHDDKAARLADALTRKPCKPPKTSYELKEVAELGECPVFDIEVDAPEHTYWTGGLLVSNCSEYLFLDDSACNLASTNLARFRRADGSFDLELFRHVERLKITAQEILVDDASYPTEAIARNSHRFRPLGGGPAALGGLLMRYGQPYDSDTGRALAGGLMALMQGEFARTSARVAAVLGPFEGFAENREPMLRVMRMHGDAAARAAVELNALRPESGPLAALFDQLASAIYETWTEAIELGAEHGYRNSQLSVCAPTGTIAFEMDCDTTGIEPEIALVKYKQLAGGGLLKIVNPAVAEGLRSLVAPDGSRYSESQIAAILRHIDEHDTIEGAPNLLEEDLAVFDCAFTPAKGRRSISVDGHLKMMAAIQPHVSGAISKTVNMPKESTVADIREAYLKGWRLGLKALAIYRDGSKESQPVSTSLDQAVGAEAQADAQLAEKLAAVQAELDRLRQAAPAEPGPVRRKLPKSRDARIHHFSVAGHEGYLIVGKYQDGRPGEVFIEMAKEGSTVGGLMDTIGVLASFCLQYGVPIEALSRKLGRTRFEPAGFTDNPHPELRQATSLIDYVFRWLELEFSGKGQPEAAAAVPEPARAATLEVASVTATVADVRIVDSSAPLCENCGAVTYRAGRCHQCFNCGTVVGTCGG